MIKYPYPLINVEKKYELPNDLVDEHNKYVGYKLTDYTKLTASEKQELTDLTNLLYPYNICASDWNKFQEITENLQKFLTIDFVNYINSTYFTMGDVENKIQQYLNTFKVGDLLSIIKEEVKKMGNFYTYIRPSATEYISFPDITIPITAITNFDNSVQNPYSAVLLNIYDNNLFGYGQFTATITVNPNIRFYDKTGQKGAVSTPDHIVLTPVANIVENYPIAPEATNMEIPPKNNVYLKNVAEKDYKVEMKCDHKYPHSSVYTDQRIPKTVVNFGTSGSNGADIYINTPFTYEVKQLLRFSPATNTEVILKGFPHSNLYSYSNGIDYVEDGTVTISNIRIYREKFTPPINSLGVL